MTFTAKLKRCSFILMLFVFFMLLLHGLTGMGSRSDVDMEWNILG